jgi:hypothetical protein
VASPRGPNGPVRFAPSPVPTPAEDEVKAARTDEVVKFEEP